MYVIHDFIPGVYISITLHQTILNVTMKGQIDRRAFHFGKTSMPSYCASYKICLALYPTLISLSNIHSRIQSRDTWCSNLVYKHLYKDFKGITQTSHDHCAFEARGFDPNKVTIFVKLGLFWQFETITNIRAWINHTYIGECCKMQIVWSGCSY